MLRTIKIFGLVLGLHVAITLTLFVQSGCQSRKSDSSEFAEPAAPIGTVENERFVEPSRPAWTDSSPESSPVSSSAPSVGAGELLQPLTPTPRNETLSPLASSGPASLQFHTVEPGESAWALSRRYGVSLQSLLDANGLTKESILQVGQELVIPSGSGIATTSTVSSSSPMARSVGESEYRIEPGDTLSGIAKRFGTTVAELRRINGLTGDRIIAGAILKIPSGSNSAPVSAFDPPPPPQTRRTFGTSARSGSPASASAGTHVVQSGETPGSIARLYGMTARELMESNGITDARRLQVGQTLQVSGSSPATTQRAPVVVPSSTRSPTAPPPAPNNAAQNARLEDFNIPLVPVDEN